MIALRGPIRRRDGDKWEWTGVWSFGTLPDELDLSSSNHSTQRKSNFNQHRRGPRNKSIPQPFRYSFEEPRDALSVNLPSHYQPKYLDPKPITSDCRYLNSESESGNLDVGKRETNGLLQNHVPSPVFSRSDPTTEQNSLHDQGTSLTREAINCEKRDSLNLKLCPSVPAEGHKLVVSSTESTPYSSPLRQDECRENVIIDGTAEEESSVVTDTSFHSCLNKARNNVSTPITNSVQGHTQGNDDVCVNKCGPENDISAGVIPKQKNVNSAALSSVDNLKKDTKTTFMEKGDCPNNTHKLTFGSGSSFEDAGQKYPTRCPAGGSWKGIFENASKRRDRNAEKIPETFVMFFNASPPDDACVNFSTSGKQPLRLPSGRIHVRGMGNNMFGAFELVGSYDLSSSVLNCEKFYLASLEGEEKAEPVSLPTRSSHRKMAPPPQRPRGTRVRSQSERAASSYDTTLANSIFGANGPPSNEKKGSHSARKRRNSGPRQGSGSGDESEDEGDRGQRHSSQQQRGKNRKRPRPEGTGNDTDLHRNGEPVLDSSSYRTGCVDLIDVKQEFLSSEKMEKSLAKPSTNSLCTDITSYSCDNMKKSVRRDTEHSVMTFPTLGEAHLARWRAAHIFMRNKATADANLEPSGDLIEESASSDTGPLGTIYTQSIYEGEMNVGESLREGNGVCLYEDGLIYEGSWRRNKEHGKGTLMTGDRKYVIYQGDWERGRMHGSGLYYYHSEDHSADTSADGHRGGGVYEGDFKENCRHGYGIYTLPDGSIFDGEWRDNLQCGRGKFTWVDGTNYVGQWKSGKRHGNGTLRAADGFEYEGQWVSNAMEGRGSCEYPNGQKYEGLWVCGKKEGRGTIRFSNGAVYEGRFKDDRMEGQGTMKMTNNGVVYPEGYLLNNTEKDNEDRFDWMIPIEFQSDMGHIHQKAGFTKVGS
eukprot:CAMPEP_0194365832 /NCGR_PEP_ID=MMETSP0174-20130528/13825_1 /TAXON_ID=216777 /ORGANISM="Proboscia alata, Strain PI-D3" /LENGTH=928 /DNA_ID=CAMNT_0039140675 /DNA_START=87 /DNA_END=2873 /DNA_ORIENTATION=-